MSNHLGHLNETERRDLLRRADRLLPTNYQSLAGAVVHCLTTDSPSLEQALDAVEEQNSVLDQMCVKGLLPVSLPRLPDNYGVRHDWVVANLDRVAGEGSDPLFRRFRELHEGRLAFLPPLQ